ncbi:MAG: hypothetical protein WBA18_01225 [Terracidiphilus sp.]
MWKIALKSLLHQLLCPYALIIVIAGTTFLVVGLFHGTTKTASYILTGTPYFPIQIAVGAITGFLVGGHSDWPLTRWVWILPAGILLASMFIVPPPHGVSLFGYWFGWSGASGHAFPPLQPGITMPFYLSATYSLFSLLGRRGLDHREKQSLKNSPGLHSV